jgi:predicted nuclease with TOPRIM domain
MTRYHKALGVFLVTLFGIWGCARGPATSGANATNDRIKALEAKTAKLEEDLKNTLALKDQLRKKLSDTEDAQNQQQHEIDRLTTIAKERETMIKTRTSERDIVQTQYESFRKNLKELIGSAEAVLPTNKPVGTGLAATTEPIGPPLTGGGGS